MNKLTKNSKITLVELPATQFGILNGKLSFDEYSRVRLPARAIHVLAGVLINDGWEDVKLINPIYHGKNGKLTHENFKRIFGSDVLGISSITRTADQSMKLAELYKLNNPNGIVIAGGPDPTFRLNEWIKYVDIVVIGEGEKTISELMKELGKNKCYLKKINGIAFKENNKIIINKPRKMLNPEELSNLPHPYYDEETRKKVNVSVIETSRGCPNNCDFCSVTKFYGRTYRKKSDEWVIEELKNIRDMGRTIFYVDDNLIGISEDSVKKSVEMLNKISDNGLNKKYALAQVTVRAAKYPEVMKALKQAGINFLCIGIESINDKSLSNLRKPFNSIQNKESIKILKENGFWIHGMLMPGCEEDTKEYLEELMKWVNENLDSVQFFPPGPLPGTDFAFRMEKEGKILARDNSLGDGHFVLVQTKNIGSYELQKEIIKMYYNFYSFKNSLKRFLRSPDKKLTFLLWIYTCFYGGLRKVANSSQMKNHLEFLKSLK